MYTPLIFADIPGELPGSREGSWRIVSPVETLRARQEFSGEEDPPEFLYRTYYK